MSLCTAQKNGTIERGFVTLYSWMRTMTENLGLDEKLKTGLWH